MTSTTATATTTESCSGTNFSNDGTTIVGDKQQHYDQQQQPLFPQFPSLKQLFGNGISYHHHCNGNNQGGGNNIEFNLVMPTSQQYQLMTAATTPGPLIAPSFVLSSGTTTTTNTTNYYYPIAAMTQPQQLQHMDGVRLSNTNALDSNSSTSTVNNVGNRMDPDHALTTMCVDYRSGNTPMSHNVPETTNKHNVKCIDNHQSNMCSSTSSSSSSSSKISKDVSLVVPIKKHNINKKKGRDHEGTVNRKVVASKEEKTANHCNATSNNASRLNKFVKRLHDMLLHERTSGLVQWKRGLLVLHDTKTFAKHILPKYFNTRNFKTFRRQLNYYGFVHVRSFNTTTTSSSGYSTNNNNIKSTTALWVNQSLAAGQYTSTMKIGEDYVLHQDDSDDTINDIESIATVLQLKRIDGCESVKTSEARRERKELAMTTIEDDLGVSAQFIALQQQSLLLSQPHTLHQPSITMTTTTETDPKNTPRATIDASVRPRNSPTISSTSSSTTVTKGKQRVPKPTTCITSTSAGGSALPQYISYNHCNNTQNDDVVMSNSNNNTQYHHQSTLAIGNNNGNCCRDGVANTTTSNVKPPSSSASVANLLLLLSAG